VSAPSSLAVDLASRGGMALVGFLRGHAMNVYGAAWRTGNAATEVAR
jgi:formate dehydrogenase assembly factor FdhD